jgi:uncharacterized protein YgfB (UPF0149 family)
MSKNPRRYLGRKRHATYHFTAEHLHGVVRGAVCTGHRGTSVSARLAEDLSKDYANVKILSITRIRG